MKSTTDHAEIKSWVESHHGRPEIMTTPTMPVLRINFPGSDDEALLGDNATEYSVTWEEFFSQFDELGLAFLYQDPPQTRDLSLAYRFIKREQLAAEIPET